VLYFAMYATLLRSLAYSATPAAPQIASDQKAKVKGTIVSRNGDVVNIKDKKSGSLVPVLLTDNTKIERKHGKQLNQKLSEERAAAVAQYLREKQNVPMRRIVVPAGYGATHPAATNSDPQGRALNRRVGVKVIVNKGLAEGN
jgi:hypothetical protein